MPKCLQLTIFIRGSFTLGIQVEPKSTRRILTVARFLILQLYVVKLMHVLQHFIVAATETLFVNLHLRSLISICSQCRTIILVGF